MIRALPMLLLLGALPPSLGYADEAPALLDPGRDPEMEHARRARPVGWGGRAAGAGLAVAFGAAAWGLRRRRRPRATNVALALSAAGVGLLLVEGVLVASQPAWTLGVKIRSNCYDSNPRGYFHRSEMRGHPEIWAWCTDPLPLVWRACEAPDPKRAPGGILALGDSFTDGVGVFARDAWPSALERALAARGSTALVANCGKADSLAVDVEARYRLIADRHAPEVVVYAFVLNDVKPRPPAAGERRAEIGFQIEDRDTYAGWLERHPIMGPLTGHSALSRALLERYFSWRIGRDTTRMYREAFSDPKRPAFVEAFDAIAAMQRRAEASGARFLVAIWPLMESLDDYPFAAAHAAVRAALEARNIAHLDLLETFCGAEEQALQVHPTDHHPNEVAHRRAADAIASELIKRAWLPGSPSGARSSP